MECIAGSGQSVSECKYTEKQKKLLEAFDSVISQEGIDVNINHIPNWCTQNLCAVDVEHDEEGNFVCCGIYVGCQVYVYFNLSQLKRLPWNTFSLIMHNGVSDIECLRMWGINVRDEQLSWDTMLIGHLLDSSLKSYGLKDMARRELGISYPSYDDIVGKKGLKTPRVTLDKQPIELVSKYNACDTLVTYRLYERQKKAMGL